MFQGILRRAELKVDSVVAKYTGRVTVAVPLIVAGGFATAALTVKLVETYGTVTAYALMAALFAMLSLVTAAIVGFGSPAKVAEAEKLEAEDQSAQATQSVEEMLTPELKAALASAAPMALPVVFKSVFRNLPLLIVLAIAAYLFSRFANASDDVDVATAEAAPTV